MARTADEKQANEAIETALLAFRDAYAAAHPEARVGTLTDWVVVAAEVIPADDPDDDETAYSVLMRSGNMSPHKALGLLEMGKQYISESDDD